MSEYKQYLEHLQNGFPSQSRGEATCTANTNQQSNPTYESHNAPQFEQASEPTYQQISKQPTILQAGNLPPSFFQSSQLQMPPQLQMPSSQFQFPNMQPGQFQAPSMLKPNMMPSGNFPSLNMNPGLTSGFNQPFNLMPNMNQVPKTNFSMNKNLFNNGFNNGFYGF